jgi:hypothetical protein
MNKTALSQRLSLVPVGASGGHTYRKPQLAAVTWDLLHEDGHTMVTWRQSYSLIDTDDGPKAFASATHVD